MMMDSGAGTLGPFALDEVHCVDCLAAMRELPDGSIDAIVTDPPYGVNYDGGHFHSGDNSIKRARERLYSDGCADVYQWVLPEIHRLLKRGGVAYVFYAASKEMEVYPYLGMYDSVQMMIWEKTNATFAAISARYHHVFEPFLYLTKKGASTWNGGTRERSLWRIARPPQNNFHPTQKPVELMARMIRNSTDDGCTVLDPFAGSGTTLVAAKQLGRRFLGFEIEPRYVEIARQRLAQGALELPMGRDR